MQEDGQFAPDLLRAAKRRKFYRKRSDAGDNEASDAASQPGIPSIASPELQTVDELISQNGGMSATDYRAIEEDGPFSVAQILRQRKAGQRRRGGIEFSNLTTSSSAPATPLHSDALVEREDEIPEDIKTVVSRFAPQTGQVSESVNDKHMMAYIDSELAKRKLQSSATPLLSLDGQEISPNGALVSTDVQRQPAALGKLHEIDLGPDATLRNIARTEAAQRKLSGLEPEIDVKTGKIRLRRDGKPYGWRKRRNSEDIKRDKLVEEVMRESKLEIYDEPDEEEAQDGDNAADDRMVEQFRREFLDAVSSRQQKAIPKQQVKGKVVDDRPSGPKLGGSRSARAKMREIEEAAAKKK